MTTKASPPGRRKTTTTSTAELTPAVLNNLLQHCQSLSRSRPRQTETILKLARAQLAIDKALEPCEKARKDLLATLPIEPTMDASDKLKEAYKKAKDEVDAQYRDIYLNQKFTVKFPSKISSAELQQFQDPPSPLDLVALHPYIVEIEEE
jgi:hypothetical protein